MQVPAVSVIIPLYNVEKYIGECLDSILAQTFQNFEVIVVDDCSTDNSVAVVKSYATKFGGRLKIARTQKNSGGGGYVPRNIGLGISRGEYIFFVDADDSIAENAIEILYTAAKDFDTDIVYTSLYHACTGENAIKLERDNEGKKLIEQGVDDEPTLTNDSPKQNLYRLLFVGHFQSPWTKFVRRDILTENEIVFPKIISGGDFIWNIHLYCHAKKILRLPIPLYFYREDYSSDSVTQKKRSAPEQNAHWVSAFVLWTKALNQLSNENDVLKENPDYCYTALKVYFDYCLSRFFNERMQLSTQELYEALARKFTDDLAVPFLFSIFDAQQKNMIRTQQEFQNFAIDAQNRITELENEIRRLQSKE